MMLSGTRNPAPVNRTTTAAMNKSIVTTMDNFLPHKTICSVYMSKSVSPVVGVSFAIMDLATIISTEINDSLTLARTINKIEIHQPSEIVLEVGCPQKLISILESNVNCKISLINKRYFKTDPTQMKRDIINQESMLELNERPHATCSASSVMTYATELYPKFAKFRFKYEPCEATMFVDISTTRSLELVENLIEGKGGISLFKFLNNTKTKMGERILRNNILQPLSDLDSLQMRVASVQELMKDAELLKDLRTHMNTFQDLDRIFNMILVENSCNSNVSDQNINIMIMVKQTIVITQTISNLMTGFDSSLLREITQILTNDQVNIIQDAINMDINEDCSWASSPLDLRNQKCYAVKSGKNGLLDISRQLYHNVVIEITNLIASFADEFELNIDHQFDSNRGFTIRIKNYEGTLDELPDLFIHKIQRKKHVECSTLDLMKLNARLRNTLNEIILMSDQVIDNLLEQVRSTISTFFMLSEAVAVLDLLACFAYNSINHSDYNFPELNTGDKIVIKESRHPIYDNPSFVPNNIISIHETSRIQIITGANMSGKSVYLRQVLLLAILAQVGSSLPADYAMLPIFNSLHARISSDTMEINASTFSSEMTEMSNILKGIDGKSLVIIDELGRGSSLNDGFAISLAITEFLANTNCTAFVTTHFKDIPQILKSKNGFVHLQMKSELNRDVLIQYHKIDNYGEDKLTENHGILMAQIYLRKSVIEDSKHISKMLYLKKTGNSVVSEQDGKIFAKRKLMLNLIQNLKILKERNQDSVPNLKLVQDAFIENFKELYE